MQSRGDLDVDASPSELAVAVVAAVEGGLLLAKTARSPAPLKRTRHGPLLCRSALPRVGHPASESPSSLISRLSATVRPDLCLVWTLGPRVLRTSPSCSNPAVHGIVISRVAPTDRDRPIRLKVRQAKPGGVGSHVKENATENF
jgi:hypothetical protein